MTAALRRAWSRPTVRWVGTLYVAAWCASLAFRWWNAPAPPAPTPDLGVATLPAMSRHGATDADTVDLWHDDLGPRDAPVVVLLHGSPGHRGNFEHLTHILTDRYRVVVPDLPGFGDSERWLPSYSTRAHARYTLALLDQLGIDSAHVFGFSMGSGVAIDVFDLAPLRVETLTFYGGIGIQEGEGTGDYHFEHLKYTLGYALLVWPPELLPHFGLLGSPAARHAFFRNFNDTDQRPFRDVFHDIDAAGVPLLILHGVDDFLVPAWTAEQHHQLVEHSELVMFDGGHFMLFSPDKAEQIAHAFTAFVGNHDSGVPPQRRTDYRPGAESPRDTVLPLDLNLGREFNPWLQVATIVGASYLLEDPTTITVGLLVRDGQLDLVLALIALFLGIFSGDLLLYALGWFGGRRLLRWGSIASRVPTTKAEQLGGWIDRHGWTAVLASRFVPGTRLPLYVAAGATGRKPGRFALWTAGAVLIWTVVMVALVLLLGEAATGPFKLLFGDSWWAVVFAVVLLLLVVRFALAMATWTGRRRWWARVSRLWRREFWPAWVFYLPLLPWLVWLSVRYRSLTVWALANPGLPHGGVVGESKAEILRALGSPDAPDVLTGEVAASADNALALIHGWPPDGSGSVWPVVLKPDAAQRGAGVRLVPDEAALRDYFASRNGDAVLVQRCHPGPFEAGVFYLRYPDEARGRVLAVTDKHFPAVTGNGRDTLERLIWSHHRYRMQAGVFLRRLGDAAQRVPDGGEVVPLAFAGNHCQGTMFTDGAHLVTPELTAALDRVALRFDGFHFGRFDLRYADVDGFRRGEDTHVIELNGVTSEATNIYDPNRTLWWAYRVLFAQWRHCFAIGDANRKQRSLKAPGPLALLRDVWRYYRGRRVDPLSD